MCDNHSKSSLFKPPTASCLGVRFMGEPRYLLKEWNKRWGNVNERFFWGLIFISLLGTVGTGHQSDYLHPPVTSV